MSWDCTTLSRVGIDNMDGERIWMIFCYEKSLISFETQDAVNPKRIIYWAEKKKKKKKKNENLDKKKKKSESLDKQNQRQYR